MDEEDSRPVITVPPTQERQTVSKLHSIGGSTTMNVSGQPFNEDDDGKIKVGTVHKDGTSKTQRVSSRDMK